MNDDTTSNDAPRRVRRISDARLARMLTTSEHQTESTTRARITSYRILRDAHGMSHETALRYAKQILHA